MKSVIDGEIELEPNTTQGLMDLVKEQSLIVPNSCNDGRCGACIGTLLSGKLNREKPEVFLAENPASDAFLACCCSVSEQVSVSFKKLYLTYSQNVGTLLARLSCTARYLQVWLYFGSECVPEQNLNISRGSL